MKLVAARLRLPKYAVFSGATAAWLHGLDGALSDPIEATVPTGARIRTRSGMTIRRATVGDEETVMKRRLRATSALRTLRDMCCRLSLAESVVLIDMALRARLVGTASIEQYVESHPRAMGIATMRRALGYAEPRAESPMESRLRLLLVFAGLPRPEAQVPIHDRFGRFVGRPDLFYSDARLGIEYDGGIHRESLTADDRRQNRLLDAGVRLLRFTASDIYQRPHEVVTQVRRLLPAGRAGAACLRLPHELVTG